MVNAPIALFVYNRPRHTAATLVALGANAMAAESDLFVFCDGPKSDADALAVAAVRDLVGATAGFRSIQVFEAERNAGLAASIIAGVTRVISEHGRVIVLEDDIVTSPHFLRYMNAALDRYGNDGRVFSVSGYNPPPNMMRFPRSYAHDVYFNPRSSSWGWATWRDRWKKADWDVAPYESFIRDPAARRAFNAGGADLSDTLIAQREGRVDSWAVRWAFTHFTHHALAVYPVRSYVDNIGHDGSGTHCRPNFALRNDLSRALLNVEFPPKAEVDEEVMRVFRRYYFIRMRLTAVRRFLLRLAGRAPRPPADGQSSGERH